MSVFLLLLYQGLLCFIYTIILFVKKGKTPYTSIFSGDGNNCVLSAFNTKKSEELAQILINKLTEFEKNKIKRYTNARED